MDFLGRREGRLLRFTTEKMKVFSGEFINFLKQTLICSWKGHKKGKWVEVYWAPAHSAGYQSRFCEVCHKELETTREKTQKQKCWKKNE